MENRGRDRDSKNIRNNERSAKECERAERSAAQRSCDISWRQSVPTGHPGQLRTYIDEVSFGAYEALLFLDTHPDCAEAMQYFLEHNEKRNFALKEYARLYGPLRPDDIGADCEMSWKWANQPWPWEGGNC